MANSTLTSKGQVTVPKAVRDRLGLKPGDVLDFRFTEQGEVMMSPTGDSPLQRLSGILKHLAPERPVTVEEMNEAIRRRAAEKYARSRK